MLCKRFLGAAISATLITHASGAACPACKDVFVDVVVLGGGAAGTYVAAQLTDVHNKNILVVDTASRLGGHVDTIRVPGVDHPIEFGVLSYHNLSHVEPFFNRYGINVKPATLPAFTSVPLDQKTAEPVNLTAYSPEEQEAAIGRWLEFGLKYKDYVYPSYNLPTPLGDAAPLARPFIETVKELKLESVVVMLGDAHWANDLLALPTLQAVSTFGFPWFDGTPMVIPESGNNTQLYANIQAKLGDKVLLNTRVKSVKRDDKGAAQVTVNGPKGCTRITAKQVVVGFVPTAEKMNGFDTTPEEDSLFGKWDCVKLYNGLVSIDGYPDAIDLNPVSSDPQRLFVPSRPTARFINWAGTNYTSTYIVGEPNFDVAAAKAYMEDRLATIAEVGTYKVSSKPEYFGFSDHSPLVCTVPEPEITEGFWTQVKALQGKADTWYVGQAFAADLTAYVWAQAQEVVDELVKKL